LGLGSGRADARFKDFSACLSSGNDEGKGQIVGKSNGEGCGAACRVVSQMEKDETAKCSG
jgi:hypothetical protein